MKKKLQKNIILFLVAISAFLYFYKDAGGVTVHEIKPVQVEEVKEEIKKWQAEDVAEAIITTETGGSYDCSRSGALGEKSCFQFMPSTFRGYAKEVLGYVPELTDETAYEVAVLKIEKWLDEDVEPSDIFLIWNQGNTRPCSSGYNSAGGYYNSCSYVEKSMKTLNEITSKKNGAEKSTQVL